MKTTLFAALVATLFLGAGCAPPAKKQLTGVMAKERHQVQALLVDGEDRILVAFPAPNAEDHQQKAKTTGSCSHNYGKWDIVRRKRSRIIGR